jgi:hypothetical protein
MGIKRSTLSRGIREATGKEWLSGMHGMLRLKVSTNPRGSLQIESIPKVILMMVKNVWIQKLKYLITREINC